MRRVVVALAFALLFAPSFAFAQLVTRVIDGDTLVVANVGTVRLIGVDTPETVDPRRPVQAFGKEASDFTRRTALNKMIRLEFDVEPKDRYGRTLAYVYLPDGAFLNAEIVKRGYGHAYTQFPFRYLDQFRAYEREAREAGRGLWSAASAQRPLPIAPVVNAAVRVWVNTASGVYHCAGTRYYGNTKVGAYMTQGEARKGGYRPANARAC